MPPLRLLNYLLSYRKRSALSQNEVAFLLGRGDKRRVSRFERFTRTPDLETALAYEVIYKQPVSELFAGLCQKVERDVAKRAKALASRSVAGTSASAVRKRETLRGLASIIH